MAKAHVIVGASLAGATAAITLRAEGADGAVILIGAEAEPPYERPPLSKSYLRGEVPFDKALVRPAAFYAAHGIETMFGARAVRIDSSARVVELEQHRPVPFDTLLIATGGRNRRVSIPGSNLEGIYGLRTVQDADRIRAEITAGRRAVVVGMGFIGSEVAASLRQKGLDVVVIYPGAADGGRRQLHRQHRLPHGRVGRGPRRVRLAEGLHAADRARHRRRRARRRWLPARRPSARAASSTSPT